MEVNELLRYRKDLSDDSVDDLGFFSCQMLLSEVLPSLFESKLIDSVDYEECFHSIDKSKLDIYGHTFNESNERLQIFTVNKSTCDISTSNEDLLVSQKNIYSKQFRAVSRFVRSSINGHMKEKIQDSSSIRLLVHYLSSPEGMHQIDVVEVFQISLTATVTARLDNISPRESINFDKESEYIPVKWKHNGQEYKKEILLVKKVIDLNFLYNFQLSKGRGEPLEVRFDDITDQGIMAIKAASEEKFESYLCVLPARVLADLYKRYSSRLLEKNVRSFLQFKGVNSGIKKTIKEEPEKFIAYNNGLTITATHGTFSSKKGQFKIKSLTDFQIVNGGQTTASIFFSNKDGIDISNVKVMAKINIAKKGNSEKLDELITKISRYSNAQSRVSNVDLNSRNKELIKFKQLSESVICPNGSKWFFERAKGEFQTKLRLAGNKKNSIKKRFPVSKRFSKELLAKYYCAWGDEPYKVKKGGEKIFRLFVEKIKNDEGQNNIVIDRDFYETTVAKIILFREMEVIYGRGKNSIGQLRSAVIPYSISIIFLYTDYTSKRFFNFRKIWKEEKLSEELKVFLKTLMIFMNDLIKKYSLSDDYGEFSKKVELWDSIKESMEIKKVMAMADTLKIIDKNSVSELISCN